MLGAGIKAKGKRSKYDAVVGCTIDVPAPIFGVDIPDLYYRGRILKKDPAHPGNLPLLNKGQSDLQQQYVPLHVYP